ncbi:hypothetical protein ACTNEO_15130 [Gracilibacillus sp. HCP3S3_G5_1]|uniref:hypothetical protein n=1 Tax=unclassified Gracilibacillus TaxID=2625209 RepID=UPI003F8958EA
MQMLVKGLLTSCILIIGFFLYTSEVNALEGNAPQIKEDIISVQSTRYIKEGNASIRRVDSQTVGGRCNTSSYSSVHQISCTINLQVKNKSTGQWVNTGNSRRFAKNNSSYVSGSVNFRIERGFDYRIRATHITSRYSSTEQLTSTTGYIRY